MARGVYFCWRSGLIGKGERVPKGAVLLFPATRANTKLVEARARLSRQDNKSFLVPGVPEAPTTEAAREAVEDFIRWIVCDQPPGKRDWKVAS
ncbi:MAG: hypothetical protein KF765_12380 [Parvibaculaceae bacterium]|nr:hypothetical protein [Parvibaculaceae bacterium]